MSIRFWNFQCDFGWNKSLKQFQLSIGKRYFAGSAKYKKAFFVVKSNKKDYVVLGKRSIDVEFIP